MKLKKSLTLLIALGGICLSGCGSEGTSSEEIKPDSSSESSSSEVTPETKEDGSKEYPYLLKNKNDLIALQEKVNDENFDGYIQDINKAPYYKLTADIDLGGMEWEPIGNFLKPDGSNIFTANIDGDGHTISNYKITEHDANKPVYGLFGFFHGFMHDINVTNFEINLVPTNLFSLNCVGGLVAYSDISAFSDIKMEGSIKYTLSKSSLPVIIGGMVGYSDGRIIETEQGQQGTVSFTRFIDCNVDVKSSYENAYVGGLYGYVSTTSGQAIHNLSYITSTGKLESSFLVGGIAGYLDRYCTISYSYANNKTLIGRTIAGGLVGHLNTDTVINNSFVVTKRITVAETLQSGKLAVGTIAGQYFPEDDREYRELSSLLMNVYASKTTSCYLANELAEDGNHTAKVENSSLVDENYLNKTLGFTNTEWNFSATAYPTLKLNSDIDLSAKVKISFTTNMPGIDIDDIQVNKYNYQPFPFDNPMQPGYTFKGWYYDENKTLDYRFYLPVASDTTLYGGWAKYSDFANLYVSTSKYGMIIDFKDDGLMNFYFSDYTYSRGSYAYYDDYLYFETQPTLTDGGWGLTYGSIKDGHLIFQANNASSSKFDYVPASSLIGYYRNGRNRIDFLTTNHGYLTIPSEDEMIKVGFTYEITSEGINAIADGENPKELIITQMIDNSINVTYDGITYNNFMKLDNFIEEYEVGDPDTPWVGKNYRGPEFNDQLGVKDIFFNIDGNVVMRTSYAGRSNSDEPRLIDKAKSDFTKGNIHWEYQFSEDAKADRFVRDLTKNKNNDYYTYTETDFGYLNGELVVETRVLASNIKRQILVDGSEYYSGTHQAYGAGSLYNVEFIIDKDHSNIKYLFYANHNYGGGFYSYGKDVFIKSTGGLDTINAVLHYNSTEDYFLMKALSGKRYILAPYEIYGVFDISGYDVLDGNIYAYKGHTYYMDRIGKVTNVDILSGDFNNDSTVTLEIKEEVYTFYVTNHFQTNTLNKI